MGGKGGIPGESPPAAWHLEAGGAPEPAGGLSQFLFNRKRDDPCFILSCVAPAGSEALLCRGTPVLSTRSSCFSHFHLHPRWLPRHTRPDAQAQPAHSPPSYGGGSGPPGRWPASQSFLGWSGTGDALGETPLGRHAQVSPGGNPKAPLCTRSTPVPRMLA